MSIKYKGEKKESKKKGTLMTLRFNFIVYLIWMYLPLVYIKNIGMFAMITLILYSAVLVWEINWLI